MPAGGFGVTVEQFNNVHFHAPFAPRRPPIADRTVHRKDREASGIGRWIEKERERENERKATGKKERERQRIAASGFV